MRNLEESWRGVASVCARRAALSRRCRKVGTVHFEPEVPSNVDSVLPVELCLVQL